jgi:UDP-N-acetyl-2-amino-2-deoxyglucuronate dehydrogenase
VREKNFLLIGAAGYVAPRHMRAMAECGGNLLGALDKNDSVGVIDSYFPESAFFTEFERFDRFAEKLKRKGQSIDYVSICTPNYLHDAHCRFGLRLGADVICEKPVVINPWNIDALKEIEEETGKNIFSILQLRLHPQVIELKKRVAQSPPDKIFDFDLTYQTSRGIWYYASWKGNPLKSGGIATNIGVHFFDMLMWIFGEPTENIVHVHTHDRAAGLLKLKKANVRWFLSINYDTLDDTIKSSGKRTYRSMTIDGEEFEFSGGFADLHTQSYREILAGRGFTLDDARPAIELVHEIRNITPVGLKGRFHPKASLPLTKHPFD